MPLKHIDVIPTEIRALFKSMTSEDPEERPTSADALKRLRILRSETPSNVLNTLLERMPPGDFIPEELPDVPLASDADPESQC
ncbi:MAG TPA: hypothetical protein VGO47_06395 [Chlamydiales bacterium]|jgi:hypothetical protein|nr:hypothetical protein [Chlamydiales bacterium]